MQIWTVRPPGWAVQILLQVRRDRERAIPRSKDPLGCMIILERAGA
jgi:hypothetical protein